MTLYFHKVDEVFYTSTGIGTIITCSYNNLSKTVILKINKKEQKRKATVFSQKQYSQIPPLEPLSLLLKATSYCDGW